MAKRSCESVIHRRVEAMARRTVGVVFSRNVDNLANIDQFHGGVHRSFKVQQPRVRCDGSVQRRRIVEINPVHAHLVAWQPILKQRVCAPVKHLVCDDFAFASQQNPAEGRYRSHSGRERYSAFAVFCEGEIFFENLLVGFAKPVVDINGSLRMHKEVSGVMGKLDETTRSPLRGRHPKRGRGRQRRDQMMAIIPFGCLWFAVDKLRFVRVLILSFL